MRLPFFLFFILLSDFLSAQDKIYLYDNSVIQAKVSEVGMKEIKFKKWENLNGPDYILPKTEIVMVIYENGTHEVMNTVKSKTREEEQVIDILPYYRMGKNLMGLNYFDLIFKNITLTYTRYLFDYHFSLNTNISLGFTEAGDFSGGNSFLYFDNDYYHFTFGANYFPAGMKKVSYYTGLSIMTGKGGDYSYTYYGPYQLVEKNYYGFYVNNGVQFNLTKHFNMRTCLGLGLVDRNMNGDFESHAMFELSAGIRF